MSQAHRISVRYLYRIETEQAEARGMLGNVARRVSRSGSVFIRVLILGPLLFLLHILDGDGEQETCYGNSAQ